jgi:prophage regulatory protein
MNHDLLDYLLKTLLDLPHADRTPKKVKSALELVAEIAGTKNGVHSAALQQNAASVGSTDPSCILIRMNEVSKIVGLARSTIYKLLSNSQSKFPRPVKLTDANGKSAPVAWVLAEVQDWTRSRTRNRCEHSDQSQE